MECVEALRDVPQPLDRGVAKGGHVVAGLHLLLQLESIEGKGANEEVADDQDTDADAGEDHGEERAKEIFELLPCTLLLRSVHLKPVIVRLQGQGIDSELLQVRVAVGPGRGFQVRRLLLHDVVGQADSRPAIGASIPLELGPVVVFDPDDSRALSFGPYTQLVSKLPR